MTVAELTSREEGIKGAERLADSIETSGSWREILVAES